MKVLHAISSIDARYGGPTTALQGLALAQKKVGMSVSVVATYVAGDRMDVAEKLSAAGVNVQLVGPATGRFRRHPDLAGAVARQVKGSEVVHIHALWEQLQHEAAGAAVRARIPYIFRPCGMLDPWSLAQSKWVKKVYLALRLRRDLDRASLLHFTANTERDLTAPLHLRANGVVVPNGINLEEFANLPDKGEFRHRYPAIGARRIVLFLSRVHFKKGLDLLIPAFAQAKLDNTILVIAGPDSDGHTKTLEALAREQNVADRVLFTGMLQGRQRLEAMVDAELFVLPSRQENFGIAVVEALACGTPVVISDQVNIHQEITAAGMGGVVPLDISELSQSIHRWMTDDVLRASAGHKGRAFVLSHYDWNRIAARWGEIYNNLALTAWAS